MTLIQLNFVSEMLCPGLLPLQWGRLQSSLAGVEADALRGLCTSSHLKWQLRVILSTFIVPSSPQMSQNTSLILCPTYQSWVSVPPG